MTAPPSTSSRASTPPFLVWILHEAGTRGPRFAVRYAVQDGTGALRIAGTNAVTPTMRRGLLGGLSATHLREGRFLHFRPGERMTVREFALWSAAAQPDSLPANEWTGLFPVDDGLVPQGWAAAEPPSLDACVTDLSTNQLGLGIALQAIKTRRQSAAAATAEPREALLTGPIPGCAPPGLIRHLRRTIDRQRAELEALRQEVSRLRASSSS